MQNSPSISLIFLMFNEETNIASVLQDAISYCKSALHDWELLVIDDGSTDRSAEIVKAIQKDTPQIRLIQHQKNQGMGAGMTTGVQNAEKKYFIFFPADGQVAPVELNKMIPLLQKTEIVLTTYTNNRTFSRRITSQTLRIFMKLLVGIDFKLQGLYLFPTQLAVSLLPKIKSKTFFFSFELIHRAVGKGALFSNTELICLPRISGKSKIFNVQRIKKVAFEVIRYAKNKHN